MDSGDFCVMSRRAVQLLLGLTRKTALCPRVARLARATEQSRSRCALRTRGRCPAIFLEKLVKLALSGLTSFSTKPLSVGFICGALLCFLAVMGALIYAAIAFFTDMHIEAPGFTTLVIVLLFSNGVVFLYLGILGEYIGQMFLEVKARPSFVVERTVNIKKAERTDERD